ncbi:uncharacterized protein LOC125065420 [Vanessa atalanta]|uniref:uncharacterized protein LOC125065420 n=1 Tax=Vanessa atalanta TaxID=42275 RepID=UPI001FCCE16A|nr:uncharacterized protein LOC125065420 [Vanessa atalanta]
MRTIVLPIVENKTGDQADKNNYRPISLATVISKVFDSVLNIELNKFIKPQDNQFGFRPGLSTESAILCVKHAVTYSTRRKTPVYACYLDMSKAFDLVSKLMAKCEAYVGGHGLIYNAKKSVVMVFEAGGKVPSSVPTVMLNGTALQRVSQFKYLDHILTSDLKDDDDDDGDDDD